MLAFKRGPYKPITRRGGPLSYVNHTQKHPHTHTWGSTAGPRAGCGGLAEGLDRGRPGNSSDLGDRDRGAASTLLPPPRCHLL